LLLSPRNPRSSQVDQILFKQDAFHRPFHRRAASLALAVPTTGNSHGTGGSAPAGWNAEVENFYSTPKVLFCCDGATLAGVAGEPTSTQTGCESIALLQYLLRASGQFAESGGEEECSYRRDCRH